MFKTNDELIEILKKRGITIETNDIDLLDKNGYSFLMHNFGKAFSDVNGDYNDSKLKDIVFLSEIDSKISTFFWRKISKIEKMLKVAFINSVGAAYGSNALLKTNFFTMKIKGPNKANQIVEKIVSKQIENGIPEDKSKLLWNIINATMLYELSYIINLMPYKVYDEIMNKVGYQMKMTNKGKRRERFRKSLIVIRKFRNLIAHQVPIINGIISEDSKNEGVFCLFNAFESFGDYKNIREMTFKHFDDKYSDNSKVHDILNRHFGLKFTDKDLPKQTNEKDVESDSGNVDQKTTKNKTKGETND